MIAHWPTLRDWIDESRVSEMARRRIERDADEWQRNGHDAAELYRRTSSRTPSSSRLGVSTS